MSLRTQQRQLKEAATKFINRWRLETDLDDIAVCEIIDDALDKIMEQVHGDVTFDSDMDITDDDDKKQS